MELDELFWMGIIIYVCYELSNKVIIIKELQ
jgi:hypothetical protein